MNQWLSHGIGRDVQEPSIAGSPFELFRGNYSHEAIGIARAEREINIVDMSPPVHIESIACFVMRFHCLNLTVLRSAYS